MALGSEKRETHTAAHHQPVDAIKQSADDTKLVAHLRPAEHSQKRTSSRMQQPVQHLDFLSQGTAGRAGQAGRWSHYGRVGPVGRPEGIVHIQVLPLHQSVDEGGVVALLAGVIAQVVHEFDAGGEVSQPVPNGLHRVPGIWFALGPPQVTAGGHLGAVVDQPVDRGQGGPDAHVILDMAVHDRHVEVDPQEDPLARRRRQVLQDGQPHWLAAPTITDRSTRRLE
jgi:hypothetical protein